MTPNNPTPSRRARGDTPPRRFGIRRADGQWYISHDHDGHRWGPAEFAGIWTTKQYADAALLALKPALRTDGYLTTDLDALAVAQLPAPRRGLAADRCIPDFDALRLRTIGSKTVSIDVTPSPLLENDDGAILWLALPDGPLAIGLTATEARTLADWLIDTAGTA